MRKRVQLILTALFLLLLTGCSADEAATDSQYHAYYINKEKTRIVETPYEIKATNTDEMIAEIIGLFSLDANNVEYRKLLIGEVGINDYAFDGKQLSLYFNDKYASLEVTEEILCRAAMVRSLMQIPEVTCVSFYVGDSPLTDSRGNVVGLMTNESFVENPGEQINALQTANITLYFSNESGSELVKTTKEVQYSSNISMDKLVMEHLLMGTKEDGMKTAIPSGTKLVSVTTTNGICYVNLDEGFMNQQYEIQEPIVIYSIVNSLTELPTVNKVQISVNGDTSGVYRDSYELDDLYERNISVNTTTTVSTEETAEEGVLIFE